MGDGESNDNGDSVDSLSGVLPKLPNVGRARLKKLREHLGRKWRFASIKLLQEVDGIGAGLAAQIHASLVAAGWTVTVSAEVPESLADVPPTVSLLPSEVPPDQCGGEKAHRKRCRKQSAEEAARVDVKACRKRGRPSGVKAAKAAVQFDGEGTDEERHPTTSCMDMKGGEDASGASDTTSRAPKRPKLNFAEGAKVTIHKDHPKFAGSPATVTGVSNGPGAWVKCRLPNGTVTSVRQSLLIAADEA